MDADRNEKINSLFSGENDSKNKPMNYMKIGYVFLIFGVLISYLSLSDYIENYFLLGLAFFILGVLLIGKKISGLFSFSDNDSEEEDDIGQLFEKNAKEFILPEACNALNINPGAVKKKDVFIFKVPVYEQIPEVNEENIIRKETEDDGFIYSVWKMHVFIASKNYMSYYSCIYDWIHNQCFKEETNEFYYSDIASVKSEFALEKFHYKGKETVLQETVKILVVSNVSGDKIEFVTEKPALKLFPGLQQTSDDLIKEIRLLFREKRFPEEKSYSDDDIDFEVEYSGDSDD